jgi:Tol biopolymer transport system component
MIAFTRVVDSRGDLWLMAADGSDQRQITEGEANDWAPAWTPDGSALVFSSDRNETDDRSNDLWIVTLDGSDPQLLFGEPNKDEASAVVALDGARVAFASDREGDARSIYIFDRFENTTTRLTFSGRTDDEPAWTTDGNTVVFARGSETNGAGRDIWTVRVGDGLLTQLTTDESDEGHPALAPDGQSYAFQRNIDGSWHILADGAAGLRDVTAGLGGNSVEPTWR